MNHLNTNALTLALLAVTIAGAQAGTVTLDWAPGSDISSLDLADGTWDQGSDWDHSTFDGTSIDAWSSQTWNSMNSVYFSLGLVGASSIPSLSMTQTLINNTGQAWTEIRMQLSTNQGEPFSFNLADSGSDVFADVQIQDLGSGNFAIIWSGGVVESGEQAQVFTSFGLFGTWTDDVEIMVAPTPGALALLGFGGLLASRRQRH